MATKKRIRTHTNPLVFRDRMTRVDFNDVFEGYDDVLDLEIGFGKGVFLRRYAVSHPKRSIVAVDVRKGLMDPLNQALQSEGIKNVYLIHGNGQLCLRDMIPDGSVDRVFIFHPDPWLKKRHHKRRIINPDFLSLLKQKMRANGRLYLTTDEGSLWDQMIDTIQAESSWLKPVQDEAFWADHYQSHWGVFSVKDGRESHAAVYRKS